MSWLIDEARALADLIEDARRLIAENETASPARRIAIGRETDDLMRQLRLINARYDCAN